MAKDKEKQKRIIRRVSRRLFPAYLALLLLLSAGLIGVTFFGDPEAGQTTARIDLPAPVQTAEAGSQVHPAADAHTGHEKNAPADHGEADHAAGQPTPPQANHDGTDGHTESEDVPPVEAKVVAPAPKFGLTERVGQGYLPRIDSDGNMPMQAYAGPMPKEKLPHVAILIGHLGISAAMTKDAEKLLPAGVSFAFSPYSPQLEDMVRGARQSGHEVLLEIPMEPEDFPDNDAGPYTLQIKNSSLINIQHLTWAMTRVGGYVGMTNAQGGQFLSNTEALLPVMQFLARRGLLFFENGAQKSKGALVARSAGLSYGRADIEIDRELTPQAIDAALNKLAADAKHHGKASGYTLPYPLVIDRINLWARQLKSKGVVLAPVSAVVSHTKP